jgi:hypothetical protein
MFVEVVSLTYHSAITIDSLTCRVLLGTRSTRHTPTVGLGFASIDQPS